MPQQDSWRYCDKCHIMFYDGYADKGSCPSGGGHQAQGFMFMLPHDVPGTPTDQNLWRYCDKCHVMFYDGYANKGVCPTGGGHQAQGFMFVLPHDVPGTQTAQNAWRFCDKCHVMFYDGYANKGVCPAGGGHQAQGFMFVLPHGPFPTSQVQTTNWAFNDFNAGHIAVHAQQLTFSSNGAWNWKAALHDDSTFYGDNYAIGFAFNNLGHGEATSGSLGASLSGPSADGSVNMGGMDAWLASNYAAAVNAGATCRLKVSGDVGQLLSGIVDDLEQIAGDAWKALSNGTDSGDNGGDPGGGEEEIRRNNLDPNPVTFSVTSAAIKAA